MSFLPDSRMGKVCLSFYSLQMQTCFLNNLNSDRADSFVVPAAARFWCCSHALDCWCSWKVSQPEVCSSLSLDRQFVIRPRGATFFLLLHLPFYLFVLPPCVLHRDVSAYFSAYAESGWTRMLSCVASPTCKPCLSGSFPFACRNHTACCFRADNIHNCVIPCKKRRSFLSMVLLWQARLN